MPPAGVARLVNSGAKNDAPVLLLGEFRKIPVEVDHDFRAILVLKVGDSQLEQAGLETSVPKSRLAHTRLVQLPLYLAVTLVGRAYSLPIELKALDEQVVAIRLHFLLIDGRGSRGGERGWAR
jgi:hypothetical protein